MLSAYNVNLFVVQLKQPDWLHIRIARRDKFIFVKSTYPQQNTIKFNLFAVFFVIKILGKTRKKIMITLVFMSSVLVPRVGFYSVYRSIGTQTF